MNFGKVLPGVITGAVEARFLHESLRACHISPSFSSACAVKCIKESIVDITTLISFSRKI
jgi:hypothetical protein